jgi:hypothetical protein
MGAGHWMLKSFFCSHAGQQFLQCGTMLGFSIKSPAQLIGNA